MKSAVKITFVKSVSITKKPFIMWDYIRNFFRKEPPPVNEEAVQTNIEETPIEIEQGPKEGLSETHWQNQFEEVTAPNNNPAEAIVKDPANIKGVGEASTTTNEKAMQNIEDRIKSIIEEGDRSKDISSYIDKETPTKTWTELHPSKHGAPETPEIDVEGPINQGESSPEVGTGSNGRGGGYGGGGGTPGKDLDILDGKDDGVEDPDEPLSQNKNEVQNPLENLAVNDLQQDENSANRLTSLFRGNNQEPETTPEVEDKTGDFQPAQNTTTESGTSDRLTALYQGDNQEMETNNLPEISDSQKDALYMAFNESEPDSEIEDYFPVDRSVSEDFADESPKPDGGYIADGPEMGDGDGGGMDIGDAGGGDD